MDLKIEKVIDHGTLQSEKVLLSVVNDTKLQSYLVADTTYTGETTISNKIRHFHWFVPKDVKRGDKIVLYTKAGNNTSAKLSNGGTEYTIFWGLGGSVWNNTGDAAILFELNSWNTTKVK